MTNHLRLFGAFSFCLLASSLFAEGPQPAKLYEQGVNAYFGGRASQADALLSEAIQWNAQDPLAYYFRALALLRQGRVAEARGDMLVGANLEAQFPQRQAIGTALERIQGCDRLMLEEFRRSARQNVVVQASTTETLPPQTTGMQQPATARPLPPQRPSTFKETDSDVLREKRIVPIEELLRPGGPHSIVDEQAPPPADTPASQPAEKVTPASTPAANPFADDAQKPSTEKAKPAEKPLPTPPQTTPAATPPAAAPPAAAPPASAPPATPPKADDNPFG